MGSGLRGAATAVLGLVVLQTIATSGGGKIAGAFDAINTLVKHALSPDVPAIPDRRNK